MKRLFVFLLALGAATQAEAARVFVRQTEQLQGVSKQEATKARQQVQDAVAGSGADVLVLDKSTAEVVLRPQLMKIGNSYILTVERLEGDQISQTGQVKYSRTNESNQAARRATFIALNRSPAESGQQAAAGQGEFQQDQISGGTQQGATMGAGEMGGSQMAAGTAATIKRDRYQLTPANKRNYWSLGAGPFFARRLESDDVFYNISGAYTWDVHPRASVKAVAEYTLSAGDPSANLINLGGAANWFFLPTRQGTAYITGGFGYGFAESANDQNVDGFTLSAGVGYQFFQTAKTSLDASLYYTVLTDQIPDEGYPQILGARLAVAF